MHEEMVVEVPFYAVPMTANFSVNVDGVPYLARRQFHAHKADQGDGLPLASNLNLWGFGECMCAVLTEDGQEIGVTVTWRVRWPAVSCGFERKNQRRPTLTRRMQ